MTIGLSYYNHIKAVWHEFAPHDQFPPCISLLFMDHDSQMSQEKRFQFHYDFITLEPKKLSDILIVWAEVAKKIHNIYYICLYKKTSKNISKQAIKNKQKLPIDSIGNSCLCLIFMPMLKWLHTWNPLSIIILQGDLQP